MIIFSKYILLFNNIIFIFCYNNNMLPLGEIEFRTDTFVYWPNGTVPFYINPNHFDHEQMLVIMTALSTFAFKTCLKFAPVMTPPAPDQHVMVFENPQAHRRCKIFTTGHSVYAPHSVILGYECLKPPQIDMFIMKALGFPFEHNRAIRGVYIDVILKNIEPSAIELFTMDNKWPEDLRQLDYDINSVMHFGERDFSKNGHRTIIFKRPETKQNRVGLSPTDLRKIDIVYGPQCQIRDRQEKVELCQSYPGVARKKRDASPELRSLRVNPDITPPPETENVTITEDLNPEAKDHIKELGIEDEIQVIVEHAHKVSALALTNARATYCNANNTNATQDKKNNETDLLRVIEVIADYAKSVVDNALTNLTIFCQESEDFSKYQRQRACSWGDNSNRCRQTYRSTKSGPVKASTQHRPTYIQSTKHYGNGKAFQGHRMMDTDNNTDITTEAVRNKRELIDVEQSEDSEINNPNLSATVDINKYIVVHEVKWDTSVEVTDTTEANVTVPTDTATNKPANLNETTTVVDEMKNTTVQNETEVKCENTVQDMINTTVQSERVVKFEDKNTDMINATAKSENKIQNIKEQSEIGVKLEDKQPEIVLNSNITLQDSVATTLATLNMETESKPSTEAEQVRLKREVNTESKTPETTVNHNTTVHARADVKETNSSKEVNGMTTKLGFMKVKFEEQRFFQGRRFRVQNPKGKDTKVEWDASAISIEKTPHKRQHRPQTREEQEIKHHEQENTKMKEERLGMKDKKKPERKRKVRNMTPKTVTLTKLNAEFYNERKWPGGEVQYVLAENPLYDLNDVRRRLAAVNGVLKRRTCAQLRELTEDEANNYEDYLVIDTSPDYVTGRVGGRQNFGSVELFRGGQHRQHAAMMVMAMLGFYFEIARHDRDKYIRVHMRHVRPDKLHHFEKIREEATMAIPYDYNSATHPAWQFWRKIGKTGISTVATYKEHDPDGSVMKRLGQNDDLLSELDIVKINSVYGIKCFQSTRKLKKADTKGE